MKRTKLMVTMMAVMSMILITSVFGFVSIPIDRMQNAVHAHPPGTATGLTLQNAYDYLTSSDRDARMGTVGVANQRTLLLSSGEYTSTAFVLDTSYVNIEGLGDVTITDSSGAVIDCGSIITKISNVRLNADNIPNALTNDASVTLSNVTVTDGTTTQDLDKLRSIEIEPGTNETVVPSDSGKVFSTTIGTGDVTFTLPGAVAGLTFTFIDASATAADDVWITTATGDSINSGTAGESYVSITDSIPQTVTIVAINDGSWEVTSSVGTWSNVE